MDNAFAVKGKTQKVMAGNSWAGGGKHNMRGLKPRKACSTHERQWKLTP